jgi:hypothetical protein
MVAMTHAPLSQPDSSGSIALALFNIQSGCNGGLEAFLGVMDQLGADIGFLLETKSTGGIYTGHSSGYNVLATLLSSGGIALFWRGNDLYKVKETQIWGPKVISLHLMLGALSWDATSHPPTWKLWRVLTRPGASAQSGLIPS